MRPRRSTSNSRWLTTAPASWRHVFPALAGRAVSVLIWTTTPWTIPSNLAIAFHPDLQYGAYEVDAKTRNRSRSVGAASWGGGRKGVRPTDRADRRGRAGAPSVPSSFVQARLARRAGRLRHARSGHRCGSHRARSRGRRLQHRREVRPGDLRAGRSGRPFPRNREVCSAASECSMRTRTSSGR